MRDLVALIRKAAVGTHSVLITGESGTGKEVVARTLHLASPRSERAFVPINCTAMPAGLLESELFGHARGAFTGAHARKRGLFEEAHGGTLFLDEIADMPVALQAKLLRVLEEGEIRAVGDTETRRVDVRIIAATNREPIGAIEAGRFREDLYYRLNVVPIHIPPLRERLDDVPALVEAFLLRHADAPVRVSSDALERLRHHSWPGNARELENAIQRALIVMTGSEIRAEDIVLAATAEGESGFDRALLDEAWRRRLTLRELGDLYTARVLDEVGGRKDDAARVLGVSRRTLYRRIGEPADSEH
jgi:transcriptional regulator with PAS, ATPase and Fis domain